MCALRKYDGGLRCKRFPSIQELRSTSLLELRAENWRDETVRSLQEVEESASVHQKRKPR
jgi:hypothetical protein